jgi:hypothetical protein
MVGDQTSDALDGSIDAQQNQLANAWCSRLQSFCRLRHEKPPN